MRAAFSLADQHAAVSCTGRAGLGSVAGMALLSGLAGWPLSRLGGNRKISRVLSATTGAFSAGLGLFWGWPLAAKLPG
jgi:hypothetical protein